MSTQLPAPPSAPAGPQHFAPPSARQLRAQAIQRLQAGLFGLAAIVLIVGLANIINDRARKAELAGTSAASAPQSEPKTDPLADVGAVPATTPDAPASASPQP